jgi:tRNA A-37 threonylcarbamoyl transferase component Bud32
MSRSTTEFRLLSNRYRVEAFLGQGGMARVHRGTDLVLDRTIAVKILAEHMARDPQAVRRFRREAQAAAGLSHPGIVGVYDTGSDGDVQYIVMEFVTGQTLADVLRERESLDPEQAVGIASAVASALAHAHRKGIVHRDIKPANVMITAPGEVKVMDFGIARAVDSETLTQTAAILGTATYFAPEQARGEPVDSRSDIYALGVVLYEMLTGRPPFVADSPVAVASMHVREEPTPPSRLHPAIGPGLEAVVLRAMAKDRGSRYQTAEDLVRDLESLRTTGSAWAVPPSAAAQSTEVIPAERTAVLRPSAPDGSARRHRRRGKGPRWAPWVVAMGVLLAVALIATLVLSGLARNPVRGIGPSAPGATNSPTSPTRRAPTTSPSPAHQAPTSVQGALTQLGLILSQGASSGDLARHAANLIAHDIQEAVRDYQDGELDRAIETLDKSQERVAKLESQGEVSSSLAERLHQGISDLQATMRAAPPSSGEDGAD